ncbi:MAG: hypothetical protein ACHQNE_07495 [Candidatus Kapaibacterium sp.]
MRQHEGIPINGRAPGALAVSPSNSPGARKVADLLLSKEASRYFLQRYFLLTGALLFVSSVLMYFFASAAFMRAAYFGMSLPILTSFASFLVTEWAFEQPNMMFMMVALMSLVLRMFNLLLAFCVGYLILKMNPAGVIIGLLVTYFAYLTIEIAYIHNKGRLLGQ